MSARLLVSVISAVVIAGGAGYYAGARTNAAPLLGSTAPAALQSATPAASQAGADIEALKSILSGAKPAESAVEAGNPVVAVVSGENITKKDVEDLHKLLTQRSGEGVPPLNEIFWPLVDRIASSRLVIQAARTENLQTSENYSKSLLMAHEQILQEAYVEKLFEGLDDEAKLKPLYDQMVANMPPTQEVKAQHILVAEEAKAKELIAALNNGADFAALAKDNSQDPGSKDNGGDLGYFTKEAMVPEFADAAFALDAGKTTPTPVKTVFGWHIIKVADKRARPAPSFEEAKPQLLGSLRQDTLQKKLAELKDAGKVELKTGEGIPPLPVESTPEAAPAEAAPETPVTAE